jgi:hypothetical protein
MSLKSLSRWYPNFKPSVSRSAGADDDFAMLVKGRLPPCMEGRDCSETRKQMPIQSMCLKVVLSCEVGSAGNTVRFFSSLRSLFLMQEPGARQLARSGRRSAGVREELRR